jgi:hypothetical protein
MKTRKTITVDRTTYELSNDFLAQVLETAVEGACAHWADVSAENEGGSSERDGDRDYEMSEYAEEEEESEEDAPFITSASFLVSKEPAQGGTLDLEGVADAIERIANGEVEIEPAIREIIIAAIKDDDAAEIDGEAADCIVQVGLFDEVAFS